MRKFAIMLGCAALLTAGASATSDHSYRVDFRFSHDSADFQSFARDRNQCLDATSTVISPKQPSIGGQMNIGLGPRVVGAPFIAAPMRMYERHAGAFYRCMLARGYRTDPNGRFSVSFSART